jgi:chaperonin GroEL
MITKGKEKLLEGINQTVDVVKSTLGAKGKTVMISDPYGLGFTVTKDGVSVAKSIKFDDDLLALGSEFVKNAALKTVSEAGDNTTTTSILVQSMCNNIQKEINLGRDTNELIEQLLNDKDSVLEFITSNSKKVSNIKDIKNIAKIASNNNEEIGSILEKVYSEAGWDVVIDVVESDNNETTYEIVNGFTMRETGYVSSQFINNYEKGRVEFENPKIYLYNGKIRQMTSDLMNIFQENADRNSETFRPLVLIVEDIEEAPLKEIMMAYRDGLIFSVAVVQSNLIFEDRKNTFIDASVFLDGEYQDTRIGKFGSCEKVIIDKDNITFINGSGDTKKHAERVKKNTKDKQRSFSLESIAAIIKVGGKLSSEISEKKDRIEDAVMSVRSAIEEGYLPGGGTTLIFADKEEYGTVMRKALMSCYNQLMINAEREPQYFLRDIKDKGFGYGYNLVKDNVSNLYKDGIYDSAKALRVSIENAVHTATNFASINYIIH